MPSSASGARTPAAPGSDGGAGLGLVIVSAIAAAHGSSAAAANGPSGGAVVTVELPGAAAPAEG